MISRCRSLIFFLLLKRKFHLFISSQLISHVIPFIHSLMLFCHEANCSFAISIDLDVKNNELKRKRQNSDDDDDEHFFLSLSLFVVVSKKLFYHWHERKISHVDPFDERLLIERNENMQQSDCFFSFSRLLKH